MNFLYEAVAQNGETVLGKIEAADVNEAHFKLSQAGYRPQSLAPTSPAGPQLLDRTQMEPQVRDLNDLASGLGLNAPVNSNQSISFPAQRNVSQLPAVPNSGSVAAKSRSSLTPSTSGTTGKVGSITLSGNAAKLAAVSQSSKTLTRNAAAARPVPTVRPDASNLGGVSTKDLMMFFQQLASLVKSGMTIYTSLENLAARTPNKNLAKTTVEMAQAAHRGERISDTMEYYPRIYPEHVVGTVRAAELGGFLEIALAEIALGYEQNIALYRGSWIPKFMATQAVLALAMAIPVMPTLFGTFGDFPRFMHLLMIRETIAVGVAYGIIGTVKLGAKQARLPRYRRRLDRLALRVPPFGTLQRQTAIAAFVRMLRKLYHAGVPPIQAWEGAMNTASNLEIRDRLADSYDLMQSGASLPEAFQATGLFQNSIENLVITGHQSGQVVESLDNIADFYQTQVDEAASKTRFTILRIGVLTMLILGGVTMIYFMKSYFNGIFDYTDSIKD